MMIASSSTKILSIAVLWALAGISVPSFSLHTGVAVVEAFTGINHHPTAVRRQRTTEKHGIFPTATFQPKMTPSLSHTSTSTSLESAKILPFLYTGISAALLVKARAAACTADRILLLAFLSYGRLDNAKLKSAKRACEKTMAICAETGKEEPSREAGAWRKAVRLKIFFRLVGMLRLATADQPRGLMRGTAFVLASSMLFVAAGGEGELHHDADGNLKPLSKEASEKKSKTLAALFIGAVLASFRTTPLNLPMLLAGVTTAAIVESGNQNEE